MPTVGWGWTEQSLAELQWYESPGQWANKGNKGTLKRNGTRKKTLLSSEKSGSVGLSVWHVATDGRQEGEGRAGLHHVRGALLGAAELVVWFLVVGHVAEHFLFYCYSKTCASLPCIRSQILFHFQDNLKWPNWFFFSGHHLPVVFRTFFSTLLKSCICAGPSQLLTCFIFSVGL